ncbi:hypothetical protein ACJMK2_010717 [Sinanodonta woodiana]|uniref:Choice-of-anchor I domain-containing protein n=1 Tax=Sinanodonta woodiana TaxID=1069815 RepID=A0ABD3VGB8_SINWO
MKSSGLRYNIAVLALLLQISVSVKVSLEKLTTLYVPHSFEGSRRYGLSSGAVARAVFDPEAKLLFAVGSKNIIIVDTSDPRNLTNTRYLPLTGVDITDVAYCGGYIFIAVKDKSDPGKGRVVVYQAYNKGSSSITEVHKIIVGGQPEMLLPTADCRKVVITIEAEAYQNKTGQVIDPEGGVGILKFDTANISGSYTFRKLDFKHFNDKVDELATRGVRHVFRENNNPFSNDVEPEQVTFNTEETKAYISLQENNAIAEVDLVSETITAVHGLGFKDWSKFKMDASDKDADVHLKTWPVFGMYQPDAVKYAEIGNKGYLITANEGDAKEYKNWSEESRMAELEMSDIFESNATRREELRQITQLGRLKVTKIEGKNLTTGKYDKLYTYGGRSFSIWKADTMEQVYDSGGDFEYFTFLTNGFLFNSNVDDGRKLCASFDSRSDDKGPEPESLELGYIDDTLVIFIGNERPGSIMIYTVDRTKSLPQPVYQGMHAEVPSEFAKTWGELYAERKVTNLDPEDLVFVPASKSPTGQPLLIVIGANSGTITTYNVLHQKHSDPDPLPGENQEDSDVMMCK